MIPRTLRTFPRREGTIRSIPSSRSRFGVAAESQGGSGNYQRQGGEAGNEHRQLQVPGSFLQETYEQGPQRLPQLYEHHH